MVMSRYNLVGYLRKSSEVAFVVFCALLVTTFIVFLTWMTASCWGFLPGLEVSMESYDHIRVMQKESPQLRPIVAGFMSDGKIVKSEYDEIKVAYKRSLLEAI